MNRDFFKNLKINKKILLVILGLLTLTQLITLSISYFSLKSISDDSSKEMTKLSIKTSQIGESSLKGQCEEYLKDLSFLAAKSSNSLFGEISNQVVSVCGSLEKIYLEKNNFKGEIPPLPEFDQTDNEKESNLATSKAYVIDSSGLNLFPLAYYIPEYSSKNVFKISPQKWSVLSEEERKKIFETKCVFSSNNIPEKLYNEVRTISNAKYILESIFESNSCISAVYLGTNSGILYKHSQDNSSERYDPRLRKWYTDAVTSSSELPLWQSSYISKSTGKLCVTCSKTFKDAQGNILGVCAIDMDLDDILKFATEYKVGKNGYNFILDSEGKIIIHPEYESFYKATDFKEIKALENSGMIKKIAENKEGIFSSKLSEESYYMAYCPLSVNNWTWVSMVKESETLEPISKIQDLINSSANESEKALKEEYNTRKLQFFIIFSVSLGFIYLICMKLSKSLSGPIIRLNAATKNIGKGNFNSNVIVESKDEIGELANSFNLMAKDLKKYIEDLARTTAEKQKIHSELMIAKKIQRSMLPCIFPAFPERNDLDIYAMMDPAKEVGGDFYDFFFIDENNLALIIADVSGKGVSAALFMVIAKILIKNQLQNGDSPSEVFKIINNRLCENNEAGMFVTCFMGIINIKTGKFVYANAGHNPPILYKKSKKICIPIAKPHGFVLGGMPNLKYSETETYLEPGDIIFLYTDGVTEAENIKGKLFSQEKLENIILDCMKKDLSIKELIINLRSDIDKFAGEAERSDDITMLAFKNFTIVPYKEDIAGEE